MDLWLVFLIGLAGSVHCVGMCGGFVIAITQTDRPGHRLIRHAAYYGGKTFTYAVLGAISGAAGAVVTGLLRDFQNVVSMILGLILILLGVWLLGWLRLRRGSGAGATGGWLSRALGRLLQSGSSRSVLGLGLLNGLLPCGLVYAMLATSATTGSMVRGALTMTVFGLATIPALIAVSLTTRFAGVRWRTRINQIAGALVIVLGVLTVLRGIPAVRAVLHGGHGQMESVEGVQAPAGHTSGAGDMPGVHSP